MREIERLEITEGSWYKNDEGIYEVVGFGNKILLREVVFDHGDDYHLGQEIYVSKGDVLDNFTLIRI